jgi:hypothetical protein
MRKIMSVIIAAAIIVSLLPACKKENIPTFDSSASIYFTATSPISGTKDSISVGFGYSPDTVTDSIVKISVSILGLPSKVDRVYKVVAVDSASTAKAGLNYDLPKNIVIHANLTIDSLAVTLHRTPDILNNPVTVTLRLEPNENFNTDMKIDTLDALTGKAVDYTLFKLTVVDGLTKPNTWGSLLYYFGPWSVKKIRLMNSVTGMPLDALNSYDYYDHWTFWGTMMNRYLMDQKAAGTPILEDDGTPMVMGVIITG